MGWLPVAATIENEIVYACKDMDELQWLTEPYFNVIPKIFSLTDDEIGWLNSQNFDFRIRYQGHRNVYLEKVNRKDETKQLGKLIAYKHKLYQLFKGRLEHGWHKAKSLMPELDLVYERKYLEALEILDPNKNSVYSIDGLVADYALEAGMKLEHAALLIKVKHENAMTHARKLERLRLRHMSAIKKAKSLEELEKIHAAIDKDLFTNMLL
jgi:hypothetical protein